jgi:HEAT repeat protein
MVSYAKQKGAAICGLLVILAVFLCCPTTSSCADKRSTRELLPELERFFVTSKWLEECRRELLERDDLLPTILQLIEQGQATQQNIWLLEDLPFERVEPVLHKAIGSKDRWVRSAACRVLGRLGDARGVPILETHLARHRSKPAPKMQTLYHMEDEGAIDAVEAVIEIKGPASDRVLENVLGHPSPILRFLAAQELARRKKESVVPVLIELLDRTEQSNSSCFTDPVYREARRALQRLTYVYDMSVYSDLDPESTSFHCDQMLHRGHEQELTKERAAVAAQWKVSWQLWWESHKNQTRQQWGKEALAWSKEAIRQKKTRDEAIERLLLIGDKEAIDLLFAFLNNPKTSLDAQALAVHDMWFNDNPLLEEPLREVLDHHPSGDVRAAAAYALNEFRSKASGEALVRALADHHTMRQAIGSLRFYPYKEFLGAVLPFLQNADTDVRDSARIAVDAIRSEPSEAVFLERLSKKPSLQDAIVILDSLRWRGTDKSLPQLVNLLRHHNIRVRKAAVQAIENIANVKFDHSERDDADIETCTAIEQWWARQRQGKDRTQLPNSQ